MTTNQDQDSSKPGGRIWLVKWLLLAAIMVLMVLLAIDTHWPFT